MGEVIWTAIWSKSTERRQNAFDLLVRKYQYKIIKLISRYAHDPSEALDVSGGIPQSLPALPGFRGDSAFYTWLYRIAINTAKITWLPKADARPVPTSMLRKPSNTRPVPAERIRDPERLLLKDEIAATVFRAIEDLPEDLHGDHRGRELEGMSYEKLPKPWGVRSVRCVPGSSGHGNRSTPSCVHY